jgi:hypothetical protein
LKVALASFDLGNKLKLYKVSQGSFDGWPGQACVSAQRLYGRPALATGVGIVGKHDKRELFVGRYLLAYRPSHGLK